MILSVEFLLLTTLLANAVNSESLIASTVQNCMDLCASCGGTSTFDDHVCDCRVPKNDEKAAECVRHVQKQQNEKFNLGLLLGQEIANRGTRCSPAKSKKQIRSGDVDRVVNYFVNGGPSSGMPIVGSAQTKCEPNETKISVNNQSEAPPVPETKIKPATGRSASGKKNVEPVATKTEIVTTPTSSEDLDDVEDPHAIEPRSFLHHHRRMLGALPQVLLGIPQALASAVAPITAGQFAPLSSAPQRPLHLLGRSQYPYLLGAAPPLPYGLHSNHAVPIHVPANNEDHTDAISHGQLINPYLGIANPLLAAVRTPYPYQSLLRTPHYAPLFGLVEPRLGDQIQDDTKTTDVKVTPPENPKSSLSTRKSEEKPSLLHQAIVQQNAILESLSHQLHNYVPALGARQSEEPSIGPLLGTPKAMQQCYCNEQEPKVGAPRDALPQASDRLAKLRNKSAKSPETSTPETEPKKPTSERKTTRPAEVRTNPPTEKPQENSGSTTNADEAPRSSRQSANNNQEYHWQYLPQYLNQFPENTYFTYRKKRGSEHSDKEETKITQTKNYKFVALS